MEDPTVEETPNTSGNGVRVSRRAIQEARLKNEPFAFRIDTMNMNGKSCGKGTAPGRRSLIEIYTDTYGPSLLFCQELPDKFEEVVPKDYYGLRYGQRVNGKEAGVMWRQQDFREDVLDWSGGRMEQLRKDAASGIAVDASELLLRLCFVKLSLKNPEANSRKSPSFLAASWHGPHSGRTDDHKKDLCRVLIRFLRRLGDLEGGIPFIVGGDFNLNTLEMDCTHADYTNVVIPSYEQGEAAPNQILYKDNFMLFPHKKGLELQWVRSFDGSKDLSLVDMDLVSEIEIEKGNVTDTLDHDAIYGILKFM